jgi:hypothetical protein
MEILELFKSFNLNGKKRKLCTNEVWKVKMKNNEKNVCYNSKKHIFLFFFLLFL